MKTYTIKTFYFNELSKEAQENAFLQDRDSISGDSFNDEFCATLEAFEKIFNISVYRWEVYPNYYTFDFHQKDGDNVDEISDPLRLATYIWNNYARYIQKGKYYSTGGKYENGKYSYKYRHSKIILEMDTCPLTGVCFDNDILSPVIDCLEYKRFFDTYDDLMTDCLNKFFETWRDCLEYTETFDFYEGEAEANGWEYLADGTRWIHGTGATL